MFKLMPKTVCIKIVIVVVWLAIWQVVALIINNSLVLSSPLQAIGALIKLSTQPSFWSSIWGSFYRIAFGFLLAAVTAILLSIPSYKFKLVKEFLAPPIMVLKTVPVASFIILLLISLKTKNSLSTIICFMMSLPVIYTNVLAGLNSIDSKMLEMSRVFNVDMGKKFVYLYGYQTLPHFMVGSKIALGLCWKSGVASELIGLVQNSIGNELYYAKLYLMMDNVFAWTIVIVLISLLFELLVLSLLRLLKWRLEK